MFSIEIVLTKKKYRGYLVIIIFYVFYSPLLFVFNILYVGTIVCVYKWTVAINR